MEIKAKCLITYPDEDDMKRFADGEIEAKDVFIHYKGEIYDVVEGLYDPEYFEPV